jgi:aldehyde:ferredoxin oxidoreductase
MLTVNLTDRSYDIEEMPAEVMKQYIGGRGLSAYLLYNQASIKGFLPRFLAVLRVCDYSNVLLTDWCRIKPKSPCYSLFNPRKGR